MSTALQHPYVQSLLSTELLLLQDYGMRALGDLAVELEAGESIFQLGISDRRHDSLPQIWEMTADGVPAHNVVLDSYRIFGDLAPGSIALLSLNGVMRSTSMASTPGVDRLERVMREAYANDAIAAVVLRINSGGGEAAAGFALHNLIQERNKPVIAYVDYAGSAAYLTASAADEIIAAHSAAKLGGIGAFATLDKRMIQDHADNFVDVYADPSTTKNEEFRAALGGDLSLLKNSLTKLAINFQTAVRATRELKGGDDAISETLSGRMYSASDAKRRGLSDMTANLNVALSRAALWAKRRKKAMQNG